MTNKFGSTDHRNLKLAAALSATQVLLLLGASSPAAATPTETVLWSFTGGTDGAKPYAGLLLNSGTLYGAAFSGGTNGQGVVFSLPTSGGTAPTVLHAFAGTSTDQAAPAGTLVMDGDGTLLGTTAWTSLNSQGTGSGYGSIYELLPNGSGGYTFGTLHSFVNSDGANPYAGLSTLRDPSNNCYGSTASGGASGYGVIFKLAKNTGAGNYSYNGLYAFSGGSDGANGYGGVSYSTDCQTLFGTAVIGGSSSYMGTVYSLSTSGGSPTTIYSFANNGAQGAYPRGGVIADAACNVLGTASFYGSSGSYSGSGAVFELTQTYTWLYGSIHSFAGSDGGDPWSSLVKDGNGNFYGTTIGGGTSGNGVVFKLTKISLGNYTYSTVYSFAGGTADGAKPYGPVAIDSSGNIYGTTTAGGANGKGVIFKIAP